MDPKKRDDARELLPQILLTVLSIIQALALEVLWNSVRETPRLWEGGYSAFVGWLQVLAVFQGLLVMWIFYLGLVLRFRWTPRVRDMVIPFFLGILEFCFAVLLEPEQLHLWLYVLAAIFVGAPATSVTVIRQSIRDARRDGPDARVPVAPDQGDLKQSVAIVAILLFFGMAVHWAGPDGWLGLAGVIAANGVLLFQFLVIRRSWNRELHDG